MTTASAPPRKRLGEIFIEQGIISPLTAERVLEQSRRLNRRFGTILEDLELVTGDELAAALALQYGSRVVKNLAQLHVPAEVLALIPVEIAAQHTIFPLKREGDRLAIAMVDPTDLRVSDFLSDATLKPIPFIATRQEIRAAICHHYLGKIAGRAGHRTVVVADDDQLIHQLIGDILNPMGYHIINARDGMEAFKLVIAEGPHVVITDMEMPKLGGYQLHTALRNIPETSFIPVILVTGNRKNEQEELKAFEHGFFDVLFKPFKPAALQARVKRAFHFYDHQYRLY